MLTFDIDTFLDFIGHEESDLNSEGKKLFRLCDSVLMGKFLCMHWAGKKFHGSPMHSVAQ